MKMNADPLISVPANETRGEYADYLAYLAGVYEEARCPSCDRRARRLREKVRALRCEDKREMHCAKSNS